ncbi:hypothetical protein MMC28_002688 [Mycoblastus sanguinarius]|nr:hypothetical protein [Mycoblastus sanguinarius]
MSYEKQHGIVNGRPFASTDSPKWAARGSSLQMASASPVSSGSLAHRRNSKLEETGVENGYMKDDVATPVKAFLSSNITPRSGSRKARAESTTSTPRGTPDGTPNSSRPVCTTERRERHPEDARTNSGLGIRGTTNGRTSGAGSAISDDAESVPSRPALRERNNSGTRTTSPESSPMFFHANDVKGSGPKRPPPERSVSPGRLPGYAHFKEENISNGRSTSLSNSPTTNEQRPKFFYANDPTELKSPPKLANGASSNRPQLQTIYSTHAEPSPPRAPSPLKEELLPRKPSVNKASPRRHTRLVSNGGSELKSPEANCHSQSDLSRRTSLNTSRQSRVNAHARSSSVKSAGPSPSRRSSIGAADMSPVEGSRTTSLTGKNGALPHSVNPPTRYTPEPPLSQPLSQPQSPTKRTAGGQSKLDQMNELAANARRERKVLDLEISNSSLLAINRTLEREMRNQAAELRRFRRLSRNGRLPVAPSSRSASGKMSILSENTEDLTEFSLSDSEEGEDNPEDLFSNLSSPTTTSRPSSSSARFQDPARIQLDLTAHRALLLDSQRLNQSIKRCLGHSESLLASGKQALEYQAQAPEPEKLGARVLTPEEIEDEILGQGQGLLSPIVGHRGSNPWERSLGSLGSPDGGLETPDYSKWGPPTATQTPFLDPGIEMELGMATEPPVGKDDSDCPGRVVEDSDTRTDRLRPKLDVEGRRASEIASLDGVADSDNESDEVETSPQIYLAEQGTDGNAASPKLMEPLSLPKPPQPLDPKANVPGNRGSMQGLGHYLQAFSIFGTPSQG